MPDERVDLAQREGRCWPAIEVASQEAIGGHAEFKRGGGGLFGDGGTVLFGEGEDAENAADAGGAVVAVDVVTDRSDARTGPRGGGEQGEGLGRGAGGPVLIGNAMPASWRAQVLARGQKSWDAGLSGTKRDLCGTNPRCLLWFWGGAAARWGSRLLSRGFPPFGDSRGGWGRF